MTIDTRALDALDLAALNRRVRLIVLLDASENAGLAPMRILRLHTFAYLSNVLAPVWDMTPLEGKLLKRHGGPFYPALQRDLDRLVGLGVARISGLGYVIDDDGRWRLEGAYRLNPKLAYPILNYIRESSEDRKLGGFFQELAFALSALSDDEIDRAMTEDATYSDPIVDFGNVIDFGEWQKKNFSANAANRFDSWVPGIYGASPGEKLHFYVRHLHTRIQGGR